MTDLDQDILFMRRLAEQGRRGSISGGLFFATAGLVFGAACLAQWAISNGQLSHAVQDYLWPAAYILYAIIWIGLFLRIRAQCPPGVANASNAAFTAIWVGCAGGIVISAVSIAIVAHVTGAGNVQHLYAPVIFCFYGVAWFVVAVLARRKWMHLVAIASFASALAIALLAQSPNMLPVMAIALLVTLVIPGFKLAIEAPR